MPNLLIMFVCIRSSVATKKGNKEGTTELAHKERPDFIAGKLLLEKIKRQKVNSKKIIGSKFRLSFST